MTDFKPLQLGADMELIGRGLGEVSVDDVRKRLGLREADAVDVLERLVECGVATRCGSGKIRKGPRWDMASDKYGWWL
jgi:DNA-binding IclR family transcriptional regulator